MSKILKGAAVAGVLLSAVAVAPAAHAGSVSFGSKACTVGTIFSRADGSETVYHEHRKNNVYYRKSFANGLTIKTNTFYTGLYTEDAASIQNGTAYLANAVRNCAD